MVSGMFAENMFEAASNRSLLYQCCSVLMVNWSSLILQTNFHTIILLGGSIENWNIRKILNHKSL